MTLEECLNAGGKAYKSILTNGLSLIRCPICKTENYSITVIGGICVSCGFDINNNRENYER